MILVESLVKRFDVKEGRTVAVDGVSFDVAEGEFFTLLGPSGCGKTTTLRCIAGLEKPSRGRIAISGQEVFNGRVLVPTHERALGMVFQSYAVWPHMSVFDNVAFPLTVGRDRPSRSETRTRVEETLELVGLGGLGERMATQMSGGQQQRLSLARALIRSPRVLLLDEPLSNLDAKLRERMRTELRVIQQRVGITTIFVTHDQVEALSLSDRIAVMQDGRIVQMGSPAEVYHSPSSAFVAQFIGGTNLLQGRISEVDPHHVTLETTVGKITGVNSSDMRIGDRGVAAIRLEDVSLADPNAESPVEANQLTGTIGMQLFSGSSVDYHVSVPGGHFQARLPSRSGLARNDMVAVLIPFEYVRVLPGEISPTHGDPHDQARLVGTEEKDG